MTLAHPVDQYPCDTMFFIALIGAAPRIAAARKHLDRHVRAVLSLGGAAEPSAYARPNACLVVDASAPSLLLTDAPEAIDMLAGYAFDDDGASAMEVRSAVQCLPPTGTTTGEFIALRVVADKGATKLSVAVDLFGSWPVYHAYDHELLAISNDVLAAALALGATEIDEATAYELLRFTHSISARSTVRGVARLLPGHELRATWTAERLLVNSVEYGRLAYAGEVDGAADAFQALVRASARLLEKYPATGTRTLRFQLSGGLDSRLMCAALAAAGGRDHGRAVTYDASDDEELHIASEVARRLELPHDVVSWSDATGEDLHRGWMLTGGQVAVHAAAGNLVGYSALEEDHSDLCVFGAWPGDVLAGSYVPLAAEYLSRQQCERVCAAWARRRGYPAPILLRLVDPALLEAYATPSEEHMRASLARLSGETAAHRVTLWAMTVRQAAFSFVSPARLLPNVLELTPCLDTRFVQQFLRLAAEDIIAKNYYRSLIWRNLGALRDIAYHATAAPITPDRILPRRTPQGMARAVARLALDRVPRAASGLLQHFTQRTRPLGTADRVWLRLFSSCDLSGSPYLGERVRAHGLQALGTPTRADVQLLGAHLALSWTREYLRSYRP